MSLDSNSSIHPKGSDHAHAKHNIGGSGFVDDIHRSGCRGQPSGADFAAAQSLTIAARRALEAVFESVDVLLAPSAESEAPASLGTTGNPIFNRLWTLLGNPCVHVPAGVGEHGLPVGVTVIGPRWADALTLSAAHTLELSLSGTCITS